LGEGFDGVDSAYGNAPIALMHLVFEVAPRTYDVLIDVLIVLGAIAPVFLFLLVDEAGGGLTAAGAAGVLLAANPLAVRFSGEGNRQAAVLAFGLAALWALARVRNRLSRGDFAAFILASVLCIHSRPEGAFLFPLAALFTLSTRDPLGRASGPGGSHAARTQAAAIAAVTALWLPYWALRLGQFRGFATGFAWQK